MSIKLYIGPMFSGKTTNMILNVQKETFTMTPALIVKWRGDNRYGDGDVVYTHSLISQTNDIGHDHKAQIRVICAEKLEEVDGTLTEEIIGIDEGQFFPDLIEYCNKWVNQGRKIIIAALDGDYLRRPFGQICELIPNCESITKCTGVCMICKKNDSVFTSRIDKTNTKLISEGGVGQYLGVCRACYK